jgi:hypothetical protein
MKGIYLSNLEPAKAKGYEAKILGQIQGFNKLGADMDLIYLASDNKVVLKKYSATKAEIEEQTLSKFINNLLLKRIALYKNALQIIKRKVHDFLYLRHPRSDPLYIYFLKRVKELNPNLVIISEIPTYPYDREYINCNSLKDKLLILLDRITRNKLKKYIDRIVVIAYEGDVFGTPSINITNGIDTSSIKPISNPRSITDEISLIGVGNVDFWHGYDRVIYGLKDYYNNHNTQLKITFDIVSPVREEVKNLQEITTELGLSEYVIFHDKKDGEELDELFDRCHLAVGDLGSYRKGLKQTAALKVRDYSARGIPFISSVEDPDFSSDFPYILKLSADNEPVNMLQVIDFIKNIQLDLQHSSKLRDYATQNLDWSIKLKPVIEIIKKLGREINV